MIDSTVATQAKGLAGALCRSAKALILQVSSSTLEKEPRRTARCVTSPNQRSTWLIQEAWVGL